MFQILVYFLFAKRAPFQNSGLNLMSFDFCRGYAGLALCWGAFMETCTHNPKYLAPPIAVGPKLFFFILAYFSARELGPLSKNSGLNPKFLVLGVIILGISKSPPTPTPWANPSSYLNKPVLKSITTRLINKFSCHTFGMLKKSTFSIGNEPTGSVDRDRIAYSGFDRWRYTSPPSSIGVVGSGIGLVAPPYCFKAKPRR